MFAWRSGRCASRGLIGFWLMLFVALASSPCASVSSEQWPRIPDKVIGERIAALTGGDPVAKAGTLSFFRANHARIDPIHVLALAARLGEAQDFEEALFWQLAGKLRMAAAREISRDVDRGSIALSIAMVTDVALESWAKQNPGAIRKIAERVTAFDRAAGYEPGYLARPYAKPESEWPAFLEENRSKLLASVDTQVLALGKEAGCKPFDPGIIEKRRAEMWKLRPNAAQEVEQKLSTANLRIELPGTVAYAVPLNYLSPFGDSRVSLRAKSVTLHFFWPDFGGFSRHNWREYPWDHNHIEVSLVSHESAGAHLNHIKRLAAEAAKKIGRENELDVYAHKLGGQCYPYQLLVGKRHSGEPVYFECSADPHYQPYSTCNGAFEDHSSGLIVRLGLRWPMLPQWQTIERNVSEKLRSWRAP